MAAVSATMAAQEPIAGPAGARGPIPRQVCLRPAADTNVGTVRGHVVDDATGAPRQHGVFLRDTDCFARSDAQGRFVFARVSVGTYLFGPGGLGIRRFTPITVTVRRGETTQVVARLRPENRVADCLEIDFCATILARTSDTSLADGERLRETALRTSIAILVAEGWKPGEFVACIDEPNERIRAALARVIPKLVAPSECALDRRATGRSPVRVHTPTGERAAEFRVTAIRQTGDSASVDVAHYVGMLWASGWTCVLERRNGAWVADACRMTWIS
jgi:hypothetical protein